MLETSPRRERPRRVVVDDHRSFAEALALALQGRHDLLFVGSATRVADAAELAGSAHADVVVMDLAFPEGDGVQATRFIKTERPQTRVLVLTGNFDPATLARALAAGADGFISKQNPLEDVIEALSLPESLSVVCAGAVLRDALQPARRHERDQVRRPAPASIVVTVSDHGRGVPADMRRKVFEPFITGSALRTSGAAPGMGIGLYLVARFATLHGGRAWLEETPGGGATVHVELAE